jgi:hypothetical protein
MHLWQLYQYPYLISFQFFPENWLTVITFRNCISSSNLGDRLCMLTGWKHNTLSLVWNTAYPVWKSGILGIEGAISLSGQP